MMLLCRLINYYHEEGDKVLAALRVFKAAKECNNLERAKLAKKAELSLYMKMFGQRIAPQAKRKQIEER